MSKQNCHFGLLSVTPVIGYSSKIITGVKPQGLGGGGGGGTPYKSDGVIIGNL